MDNFVKELDAAIGKLIEYDKLIAKKPKDYGCGVILSMSEIHTIEAIGNHPNDNLTELAGRRGVTKGSLSKMLTKLEKLGLIRRYQFKSNKKDCYVQLTELGQKAYDGHYAMHERCSKGTHQKYQQYTPEEKALLLNFLNIYIEYLEGYL